VCGLDVSIFCMLADWAQLQTEDVSPAKIAQSIVDLPEVR
jgi:hypothetical protein